MDKDLERLEAIRKAKQPKHAEPTKLSESLATVVAKPLSSAETAAKAEERHARQEKLVAQQAESAKRAKQFALYESSGLPLRHRDFDPMDHLDGQRNEKWQARFDWLEQRLTSGMLVALLGERGTGKTQLAACLIREWIRSYVKPAMYVRAMDIFMAIKRSYRGDAASEQDEVDRFIRPRLLVIDEAHERGETDWEDRMLTYIVDVRYGDLKDTVLISNSTPADFKDTIGLSIYSRLIETGGVVVCDWPSFRKATP